MFDDDKSQTEGNQSAPPRNLPVSGGEPPAVKPPSPEKAEPEDILAGVDSTPTAPVRPPSSTSVPPLSDNHPSGEDETSAGIPTEYLKQDGNFPWKAVLIIIAAAVLLAGGTGAYIWYQNQSSTQEAPPDSQTSATDNNAAIEPVDTLPEPSPTPALRPTEPLPNPDADSDGLTLEDEIRYGTDPLNPDTDGDGLFDGEEVTAFDTDPLSSDTDGDGFSDGEEVRNGFNPKGSGRLFNVPR